MFSEIWERVFKERFWGKYPAEDLVRFVAREIAVSGKSPKDMRALELGCGPGPNLWLLAREGIAFDAIDGSESAVEQARQRLTVEVAHWTGRIVVGDFCRLPEDFTDYDFVLDSEALYCNDYEESKAIIRDVHRRLRAGGAFWSRTFGPGIWGLETARPIGANYWLMSEGPLAGKGPARITHTDDIGDLYGNGWQSVQIGEITRHDGNPRHLIREWIIVARKS